MMTKGEQTRETILEQAAQIFSRKGYFGSSLADIAHETGLGKSGIYNHFDSKDDLALEAFDYAIKKLAGWMTKALEGKTNAVDRLLAVMSVFQRLGENSFLAGGCPVLNTAVESDDAHPALRLRTQKAVDDWQATLHRIIRKGIERGEIQPETEADTFATVFISTLEGAVMLSKLYGDSVHIRRAVAFLTAYINHNLRLEEQI